MPSKNYAKASKEIFTLTHAGTEVGCALLPTTSFSINSFHIMPTQYPTFSSTHKSSFADIPAKCHINNENVLVANMAPQISNNVLCFLRNILKPSTNTNTRADVMKSDELIISFIHAGIINAVSHQMRRSAYI